MRRMSNLLLVVILCYGSVTAHAQEPPNRDACRGKKAQEIATKSECNFKQEPEWLPLFKGNKPPRPAGPKERLKAIVPDFQVNENAGPCGAPQAYSSISIGRNGYTVITWCDGRNDYADIFAQIYDSEGRPVGDNFMVNSMTDQIIHSTPNVGMDKEGNFVIAWNREGDESIEAIMARCYTKDGVPKGPEFKLNWNDYTNWIRMPMLAVADEGLFAVAWVADWDNYIHLCDKYGNPIGDKIALGDPDSECDCCDGPSIAAGSSDYFIVTWDDWRNGNCDIFAQIVDEQGEKVGSNFMVNEDGYDSSQGYSFVAMCDNGNFLIGWTDYRLYYQGNDEIYARVYSADGTPLGGMFLVNDDQSNTHQYVANVISYQDSSFLVYWYDDRNGEENQIYGQFYDRNGIPIGSNFKIDYQIEGIELVYYSYWPMMSMCADDDGELTYSYTCCGYESGHYTDYNILTRKCSGSGNPVTDARIVNDDENSSWQGRPSIYMGRDKSFLVTWMDQRNGMMEYFYSVFSNQFVFGPASGRRIDKIHDDILMTGEGEAFVMDYVYEDNRHDIYGTEIGLNEGRIGEQFKMISLDSYVDFERNFHAAMNNDGIVWLTWVEGDSILYCQPFSTNGNHSGSRIKIYEQDDCTINCQRIAVNDEGDFVICWSTGSELFAQTFSENGKPKRNPFLVYSTENQWGYYISIRDICINNKGRFAVTWIHDNALYVQICSFEGKKIGHAAVIEDESGMMDPTWSSMALDYDGKCIVVWWECANSTYDVYGQRINPDGSLLGDVFEIPCASEKSQTMPKVALSGDFIFTVWEDNRIPGRGGDVWANVLSWDHPEGNQNHPTSEDLCQNYPNPFNDYTLFHYTLEEECKVNLVVYNVLGREIKTLVDKRQEPGTYTVFFGSGDLSSGVYFYRFKAGEKEGMKKMVVMK